MLALQLLNDVLFHSVRYFILAGRISTSCLKLVQSKDAYLIQERDPYFNVRSEGRRTEFFDQALERSPIQSLTSRNQA